ncbi:MAG: acetyl-CoA hydrolase/transferase family protein [Chloroflexi bacterium]|nr:acetyl-CoA hydrolase/transferase family protein [Chloroflexota bacterium]
MNWQDIYRSKVTGPDEAVKTIRSNQRIYIGGGAGFPQILINSLVGRAEMVRNVEIVHMLTHGDASYVRPEFAQSFRHLALFMGENVRRAVQEGRGDYMPVFLSEIPALFRSGALPLDAALIMVSPPDEHGFCSFGVEVGCTKPAAESASLVIAEVNRRMPRTLGDSFIHVSRLHRIVEVDYPLPDTSFGTYGDVQRQIGENVAQEIPNGATLQLGIGAIPDAVLAALHTKRDLGIHTEMFSDGVVELVARGVITNDRKTLHRGKMVAGFLFGTETLYNFVQDNPIIEMHPTEYVNDPFIIAQNELMISINSAIEVDLTGQVCADSIGNKFYSGIGGQVDFIRGAARSKGGKPIIALPSTAKDDTISRIVPSLKKGAGVVTSRGDIHYVITEYGVAYLHGRTVRQRVEALISIAHPAFRENLRDEAHELGYI